MASRRRVGLYFTLGVLALLGIALGVARWYFSGPRLARFLEAVLFSNIRGTVVIEHIDWPFSALIGRRLPVHVVGLKIYDPNHNLVLDVPSATANIEWLTVIFGHHDVIVDSLVVNGGRALIREELRADGLPEIGFLATFQPKVARPPSDKPGNPGPIIYLGDLTLRDVQVDLIFRSWNAHLPKVSGTGYLRQAFRTSKNLALPPHEMDFTYALAADVPYGSVEFAKQHFDLVAVHANRFGAYPHEADALAYSATARTIDGADLRIEGKLKHIYDPTPDGAEVELRIDAFEGGLAVSRLTFGYLFGAQAAGTMHLEGKMRRPVLTAEGRDLELVLPTPFTVEHAGLRMELATLELELGHASLRGLHGRAEARAKGNLTTYVLSSATINITEAMSLGSILPPAVARELGTSLTGSVHLEGLPYMLHADRLNLQLGRLEAHGPVKLLGGELRTSGLSLTTPDATASVAGAVGLTSRKVAADFKLSAADLRPTLTRLGLPQVARALDVPSGTVRGTLERPVVNARATVIGLPVTPRLDADLSYAHGERRLDLRKLTANTLGGTTSASGSVVLGARPRLLDVRLDGERLDLSGIPGTASLLHGLARVRARATGSALRPAGAVDLDVAGLAFGKVKIGDSRLRATADERNGVNLAELRLGALAKVRGTIGWAPYPLALDVRIDDLPLTIIPEPLTGPRKLDLEGRVRADVKVRGDATRPTLSGQVAFLGLALFDTILGSGTLDLAEEPGGRVRVRGRLFQNKLSVDASVALGGPLGIDARGRITLHKVDLDELFASELAILGAHGWVSGTVDVQTAPQLVAEVHLHEARLELEGADAEGRPAPIIVENQGDIAARYDGAKGELRLLAPAVLRSEGGSFTVEGAASPQRLAVQVRGDVQLRLLEFYTRRWLDSARGSLTVDVALGGSAARPTLDGKIAFKDAAATPRGQEAEVRVPAGELIFSLNQVAARNVAIEVEGQTLTIDGNVKLLALKPTAIDATIHGRVAGKLLEMIAPEAISHAAGSAEAHVVVRGKVDQPQIQGEIVLDQVLEVAPRALRREITLSSGRIRFTQDRLVIDHLAGLIDEGELEISGGADLSPYLRAAVRIDARGFTHRVPGVLEVELATGTRGLNVAYDRSGLSVSGDIDIIDGRFVQPIRFDRFASNIAFPERTVETSDPFWKGSPLLANMRLDLDLETKGTFAVANQVVNLTLAGKLNISGTPPRPIFSGSVESLREGTVRIPATKIREFAVSQGRVDFSPYLTFPTKTPTVLLRADAPFVDLTGTEHRVYLEVTGTLSRYDWRLWTSTNLTQAQTMALITFGRVTDDLRARVRGSQTATVSDSTTGPTPTATGSATDEVLNELSGDVIDALIADTLRNLLSLDCFNLSVSGTSVRATACKKLGAILTFSGQYEQGLGWYRYDAGFTLRPADDLSFVLQQWGLKSVQEAEGTQNALRLQLKYNFTLR